MSVDVIIVGGGLAGSTLATTLARKGRKILVLERETAFKDRVRGENMLPWGVATARRLGVVDDLVAAGGHLVPFFNMYAMGTQTATGRCHRPRRRPRAASTCITRICRRRCLPARRRRGLM
jgi:2-polyprenyl-6-methoxyphenol hydroxylase-like FAD-dependent oxidoreductase